MEKRFLGDAVMAYVCGNALCHESDLPEGTALGGCEAVRVSMDIGARIWRDTLVFLFETAVNNVFHFERNIKVIGAIGDGYYFLFKDGHAPAQEDADSIEAEMRQLAGKGEKIKRIRMETGRAMRELEARCMDWSASLAASLSSPWTELVSCCSTLALSTSFLADDFSNITVFELRRYHDGFLLRFPKRGSEKIAEDWKDDEPLFESVANGIRESDALSIDTIGQLNMLVAENGIEEYIEVSENLQRRRLVEMSDRIQAKGSGSVKVVFIAGPSSSNKTTFAQKLCLELKALGRRPIVISLDDYYFTKDKVPRNEFGDPDLECIESIDTRLFRENLHALLKGESVLLPDYEFNFEGIGRRSFPHPPVSLPERGIVLVEGIHALNRIMADGLDPNSVFSIYVSPFVQLNLDEYNRIRSTDLRILRRLVRDFRKRFASAKETLSMWPAVENGERKYIFPFQSGADAVFNSAHSYEIGVLSVFAIPLLRTVRPDDGIANYLMAQRLLGILAKVNPINPELVPSTSMLQEFIG